MYQFEFLYHVIPWELYPIEYPDCSKEERYIIDLFVARVYHWVVEDGQIATYAGVKYWLTLNEFELDCCSARIMPSSVVLMEFAEQINNRELLNILEKNQYNTIYYVKLFCL